MFHLSFNNIYKKHKSKQKFCKARILNDLRPKQRRYNSFISCFVGYSKSRLRNLYQTRYCKKITSFAIYSLVVVIFESCILGFMFLCLLLCVCIKRNGINYLCNVFSWHTVKYPSRDRHSPKGSCVC